MKGKSRPAASAAQALAGMDQLIALSLVGQHDGARHRARALSINTSIPRFQTTGEQPERRTPQSRYTI
jgi:hypothetical protein